MDQKNIKYIFIILTPFQLKTMLSLFKDKLNDDSVMVFFSKYIDLKGVNKEFSKELPSMNISLSRILKLDLKYILKIRKDVRNVKIELNYLIKEFQFDKNLNIIIGSDKDLFTQILLNTFIKNKYGIILTAVDEGLGYYKSGGGIGEKIKKYLYRLLTPIVFNERINYVYTLGLDRRINIIYARLIEKLPYKNNDIVYKKINTLQAHLPKDVIRSKEILIFSFPSADYNLVDNEKSDLLDKVINFFPKDYILKVKPHPREVVTNDMHSTFGINNIFDLQKPGEEGIDYFMYEYIVHFSSSMIIDIISKGYPADRIISISFNNSNIDNLFNGTKLVCLHDLDTFRIKELL